MGKNVLVITGSPRKHGNSDMLADSFITGAEKAGHKVTKYEAAFTKISGCHACDTCRSKGVPCSFRGMRPFLSDKYDLTKHPNYKYTSDYDPKNAFNIEKFLNRKLKASEQYDVVDAYKTRDRDSVLSDLDSKRPAAEAARSARPSPEKAAQPKQAAR